MKPYYLNGSSKSDHELHGYDYLDAADLRRIAAPSLKAKLRSRRASRRILNKRARRAGVAEIAAQSTIFFDCVNSPRLW